MSNPKGNPATLKKYTPKWKHGYTRTIRVPVALADEILDYAHQLDSGSLTQANESVSGSLPATAATFDDVVLVETLTQVIEDLENVCKTPHTSKFTRVIKTKIENQIALLALPLQIYRQKCKIGGRSQDI